MNECNATPRDRQASKVASYGSEEMLGKWAMKVKIFLHQLDNLEVKHFL